MRFFKPAVKLEDLDQYSYNDILRKHKAFNLIKYPVNARLEFEIIKAIEHKSEQEVRERFKLRAGKQQCDILVDWTQFHGIYIPSCYLETKHNPEACMDESTLEYIREHNPESLKDGTACIGLFSADDKNSINPPIDDTPRAQRNLHLGSVIHGYLALHPSEEKITGLFGSKEYRDYAAECARIMLENAASSFNSHKRGIKDKGLRKLIGMLITHYQGEIGEPKPPSSY